MRWKCFTYERFTVKNLVRQRGFEPLTFCSGGSWSHCQPITYIDHSPHPPLDFLKNSALFVANWWGNWWGSHHLPIRALARVAASYAVGSEAHLGGDTG
jgi:hypothetical protein